MMRLRFVRWCLAGILWCQFGNRLEAQAVGYTQDYLASTSINPAFAGNIEGIARIAALYRHLSAQTLQPSAYLSPMLSMDFNLLAQKIKRGSIGLGIRAQHWQDLSGTAYLSSGFLSLAYHLQIGSEGHYFVSFGMEGGATRGSTVMGHPLRFDAALGATWSAFLDNGVRVKVGFAFEHLVTHDAVGYRLDNTPPATLHGDAYLPMGKVFFVPHFLIILQDGITKYANTGMNLGYTFGRLGVYVGSSYRFLENRAALVAGIELDHLKIGGSYDRTTRELQNKGNDYDGWEVSVVYLGFGRDQHKPLLPMLRFF